MVVVQEAISFRLTISREARDGKCGATGLAAALPGERRLDLACSFRRGSATLLTFNSSKGITATFQAQMVVEYVHIFQRD